MMDPPSLGDCGAGRLQSLDGCHGEDQRSEVRSTGALVIWGLAAQQIAC